MSYNPIEFWDRLLDELSIGVPYKDKSNIKRWKQVNQDKREEEIHGLSLMIQFIQKKKDRIHQHFRLNYLRCA